MIIPVKTSPDKFFDNYIKILNVILKLRKKEAEILKALLRLHYTNRHLPNINELLFSTSNLRSIRLGLNMSVASFNNHKMNLRTKGALEKDRISKYITDNYPVDGKLNITFAIKIHIDGPINKNT